MQRKAYVPGAAVLLAALLTACTGSAGSGAASKNSRAGDAPMSAPSAQPGKYHTLADACTSVGHGSLDSLLPGLRRIPDQTQRDQAYQGQAELTYNNDRRSGCRWKAESTDATDHLFVDFERVVSYDSAVSDDDSANAVYAAKAKAAGLAEPSPSSTSSSGSSPSGSGTPASPGATPSASRSASASPSLPASGSASASVSGSPSETDGAADLQPRTLDNLGDEAFVNDQLNTSQQRTVTVVFRTSNVIVTIEYDEQPATAGTTPSSKDMQDRARKLAEQLAGSLG
ncbi:lipoprotein [Streptomyces hygroscopicus]|uniref:DUF3558 domain-containing protein n=1 Tax=Streptomyces hygroscopicus TaxID=1912 RepID=UPI00223F5448|nr:DUF3558 domain-containing protein [Streptomyces hygroscopicus]MCW7946755.1 lipoprotein [Streptomyces hygroscopicus]